jgi:PAS domain S-box-containing protein
MNVALSLRYRAAGITSSIAALIGFLCFMFVLRVHLAARTRAAASLAEARHRLRTTLDSIGDGVITTDANGNIASINAVAEALSGWTDASARGQPLDAVFNIRREMSRERAPSPLLRVLSGETLARLPGNTVLVARDGRDRQIDHTAAPIRGEHGELLGCVIVFRDVTEQREAEKRLQRSERHLRMALKAARMVAFELEPASARLTVTENVAQVMGLPVEGTALDVSRALKLVHLDDLPRVQAALQDATQRDQPFSLQVRIVRPDTGQLQWMEAFGYPLRDEAEDQLHIVGVALDSTERKRAEETLRDSEQRFRTMAEAAPVLIWMSDASGECTYANRLWQTYSGLDAGEGPGAAWLDVFHAEDRPRFAESLKGAIARGAAFTIECRLRRADGAERWSLVTAAPRFDQDGTLLGHIGSILDIEDRKVLENDLRKLAANLSQAHRRKDEFLATLAHELRNPLAPLRNGLEILRLQQHRGDGQAESVQGMMDRQLRQLVRLVDDLLDVSRITGDKLELRREPVSMGRIIGNAVETSRPHLDAGRHDVRISMPSDPASVMADETRLGQVFANLLHNATKFSERGRPIWIDVEQDAEWVTARVRDEGVGIPPALLSDVFDLFTQGDRSLERAQGGLGIGLTLVKRLVEMHNGTVEARSEGLGKGTEFVVRIPVHHEEVPEGDLASGANRAAGDSSLLILVADDNPDSATSLAMMLRLNGHDVRTANDGLQAVELAEATRPHVILLDLGMPLLNGYEACRRIRHRAWARDTSLIALTGWGQERDRRLSSEAGFDHHLVKPVDPAALERLLASLARPMSGRSAAGAPSTS